MAITDSFNSKKQSTSNVTREPNDQLAPDEDDLEDLDMNDTETEDDEPYEGIRHGEEEDEGLVDDNMSGMPVVPSPS